MCNQHALKRPSQHAFKKGTGSSSITKEEEPSGATGTKPGWHTTQPPHYSLKAMFELEHVKRKISENQRRARTMEKRRLGNATDRPQYKVFNLTLPGRWSQIRQLLATG